ncbi:type VII secretion-associated protein [Mycolicibacter sinensis]|uniref:Type VII secretion-associated protein n=1 Tax=Mycolicibacter sinensis (strain JDM601) TaxID=875328 RepID=A0A1A2ELZ3_MYCSD|nr:type VII secretion-associated protein [Mycolicibacter sinensis]OBG05569.1 type VII secretion-associated protein [Mycolicibacter sinensis]OBG07143.1 type VII secretion-associated protein [Mycolicibacter sinensis]
MTHRAVIEVGPATVRRLCCGAGESSDAAGALGEWIDEPFALVEGEPVEVAELLRSVLACPAAAEAIEIIHPSWWPARRVELVSAAARGLAAEVVTRSRARLLADTFAAAAVVEIATQLVAVTAAGITAEPRVGSPGEVAAAVAHRVREAVPDRGAAVLIDAAAAVGGAGVLADLIAEKLRDTAQVTVLDALPTVQAVEPAATPEPAPARPDRRRRLAPAVLVAVGVVALGLGVHRAPPLEGTTVTNLIEGRVTVEVPAGWSLRRVTAGPGSARMEVVSPNEPQLMLHVTQAPAVGETLADIAEPLQLAMKLAEAEAPGVFVGFDPAGSSAGRPAVTYREIRADHHVDWTVLVDRAVRIGIGCQSGPGDGDVLLPVCEQAVRSAHALGVPPAG